MGWRTSKKLRGFSHVHADLSLVLQISREGKFKTVCILFAKLFLRHTNSFPYVLVSMIGTFTIAANVLLVWGIYTD